MSNFVSAVIIEDEKESQEYLMSIIKKNFKNIVVKGIYDNVEESITTLNQIQPELVFMDIELVDGTAFDILDSVKNYDFEVIFITAHSQYLEKSMGYYALNYITKPIDVDRFKNVIDRYSNFEKRVFSKHKYELLKGFITESKLLLNTGNEHVAVSLNDIIKCEADGNFCHFYMTQKLKYMTSHSLKYYEELLNHKGFFRANRSIMVNISHIQSIYKKEAIVLSTKEKIIVSVRNRSNLVELIKNLS